MITLIYLFTFLEELSKGARMCNFQLQINTELQLTHAKVFMILK